AWRIVKQHRCTQIWLVCRSKKKIIEKLVKIQNDGTVEVDVTCNAHVASELLELDAVDYAPLDAEEIKQTPFGYSKSVPRLKIAMLVVGTRGDVQPFIALAKRLQAYPITLQEFGHHVRLATHVNFHAFVKSAGIGFYPLGGDPRIMAASCTEPDLDSGAPFRAQAIIANPPAY
ncbi:Sterol 3-beta-glucosyltransferase UGT80B1, partial [Ananas comosus]